MVIEIAGGWQLTRYLSSYVGKRKLDLRITGNVLLGGLSCS